MEMNTSVLRGKAKSESQIEKEMAEAARALKTDKMVKIMVPEAYRAAFGDPFQFFVNGVSIEIPYGVSVEVPEPHALHAQRLMKGAVLSQNQRRLKPEEVYKD